MCDIKSNIYNEEKFSKNEKKKGVNAPIYEERKESGIKLQVLNHMDLTRFLKCRIDACIDLTKMKNYRGEDYDRR
jgi:hypothetical protein